jgi:formylglycine-generating enzyme
MRTLKAGMALGLLLLASHSPVAPTATAASLPQCLFASPGAVTIPGGKTQIGDNEGYADERPAYVTQVDGFAIGATEVTVGQFAEFTAATRYVTSAERRGDSLVFSPPAAGELPTHPSQWWKIVDGADWRHPEGPGSNIDSRAHYPVTHVSFADAQAYARWRGERLPNEEEFERAARAGLSAGLAQPEPESANTWQGKFPYVDLGKDGHKGVAPVGCFRPSAYGLHDMIGNVWEWTSSHYLPGHGPVAHAIGERGPLSFDPSQPEKAVRVIKGGSFLCAPNYCARYRPSARHAQAEEESASHIGFRTVGILPSEVTLSN